MNDASFAADWLALRAPFDAAATGRGAAAALARRFGTMLRRLRERGVLSLLDLGGGAGGNVCRLAPMIHGSQHWTVIDSDPALLAAVDDTIARWGRSIGGRVAETTGGITVTTPQRIVTVAARVHDLRNGFAGLPLDTADGVAGSALLDLVSEAWLADAVEALAVRHLPALFTLNVDGVLDWSPPADDDAIVAAAFGRDLIRDKGFGPALGPHAAARARSAFAARGYTVEMARADWQVGSGDAAMHRALLSFISLAARRQPPKDYDERWAARVDAWDAAKGALVEAGGLALRVGHVDLLAGMSTPVGAMRCSDVLESAG
jgi:hypothetical protein